MILLLQWNCQGLYAKWEELQKLIYDYDPLCLALQELILKGRQFPTLKSYHGYFKQTGLHGGAAVYIHHKVPQTHIPLRTALQAVAVRIFLGKNYTVCSIYLPPNEDIHLSTLLNIISQLPEPFLLMGDFNARHSLWGDKICNTKGILTEKVLTTSNISILNDGNPTSYHIQTDSFTCIDLTLCSTECMAEFTWKVDSDLRGSDHFPVILENLEPSPPQTNTYIWNTSKANWGKFTSLSKFTSPLNEVDKAINDFTCHINKAANSSMPKITNVRNKRPLPWWNEECKIAVLKHKEASRKFHKNPTSVNKFERNRTRALRQRTLRQSRKNSLRNYITTINSQTSSRQIWNRIKKISGRAPGYRAPNLKEAGELMGDSYRVANIFANFFAELSNPIILPLHLQQAKTDLAKININFLNDKLDNELYNRLFTIAELKSALKTCKKKAPGPDGLTNDMLQHLHPASLHHLLDIYNLIWIKSTFPTNWRRAIILPIQKPGKDGTDPSDYRPISLTCSPCKLFEKMVNTRLVWFLEYNNLLNPNQSGFRKMHSAPDLLVRLEATIRNAFAKQQHAIGVFFDIKKAYDTVWQKSILKQLHLWGMRGHLPLLIKQFLSSRSIQVKIGSTLSNQKTLTEGIPQGGILSVTCFGIAINGILEGIPDDVTSTLYVDDLAIICSSPRLSFISRKLQKTIYIIESNAAKRGLTFSASKTKALHFFNFRRKEWEKPTLYLYKLPIEYVAETKFLGLILDTKLTWKSHLQSLKQSCTKKLDILKFISNIKWGSDCKTLWMLYTSLIQSRLDYGAQAYSSASKRDLKTLEPIRNLGARLSSGAFKSSPINSIYADSDFLPLEYHRLYTNLKYIFRIKQNPDTLTFSTIYDNCSNPNYDRHPTLTRPFGMRMEEHVDNLGRLPILQIQKSNIPPWLTRATKICDNIVDNAKTNYHPNELKSIFNEHVHKQHYQSTHVYTDGSKSAAGAGSAAVFTSNIIKVNLPVRSSIFTAELIAVMTAIMQIEELPQGKFTIFIDSTSVIKSLQEYNPSHPLVVKIKNKIHQMADYELSFCWVPSHVNIIGNEIADAAAKEASLEGPNPTEPLPVNDIYPSLKSYVLGKWQSVWNTLDPPTKLHSIKPLLHSNPSENILLNRKEQIILSRLRIGHTRLTHGYLMSNTQPPICQRCGTQITVKHIFAECRYLANLRVAVFPFTEGVENSDETLKDIFYEQSKKYDSKKIFTFLKYLGIFNEI